MKANEAPEKIHIQPNAHDRWFEGDIPNGLPNGLFVEYIRTDAFIEKACEYWQTNLWRVVNEEPDFRQRFVTDFKKYMEGE